MVGEAHRLRRLQVGEARHGGGHMLPRPCHQHPLECAQPLIGAHAGALDPQAEVGGHLVVARTGGVQPAAGLAYQFGEARLDVEMDVLERRREGEAALLDLARDPFQAREDGVAIGRGDDAAGGEHARVRP